MGNTPLEPYGGATLTGMYGYSDVHERCDTDVPGEGAVRTGMGQCSTDRREQCYSDRHGRCGTDGYDAAQTVLRCATSSHVPQNPALPAVLEPVLKEVAR